MTTIRKMQIALGCAALLLLGGQSIGHAEDSCEELRIACQMKRQLGEVGEGNCKAFRACKAQVCGSLREACMHKAQLGEKGEGNCRRYRDTCRR